MCLNQNPTANLKLAEGSELEFIVAPKDAVIIERHFKGQTDRDLTIERQDVPIHPLALRLVVKIIRFYQKQISPTLGNRCVFDPSCSHYSEMAFRKKGILKGIVLTVKRLCRCRPENGGVDELL